MKIVILMYTLIDYGGQIKKIAELFKIIFYKAVFAIGYREIVFGIIN